MSKIKHSDNSFTNELTRNRRAWIDRALAGVKGKVEPPGEMAETCEAPRKPDLYVVKSLAKYNPTT